MNADTISVIILAAFTLSIVITKTHVAFVTLALCTGFVLREELGADIFSLIQGADLLSEQARFTIVQFSLLFTPAILVAYRFHGSQKGVGRMAQQLVPAFALALLGMLFVFTSLPADTLQEIKDTSYVHGNLESARGILIGFAVSTALFDVLVQHAEKPKRGPGRPKKGE